MASALELLLVVPRKTVMDSVLAFQQNSGAYDMVAKVFYYSLQLLPIVSGAKDRPNSHLNTVCGNLVKSLLNLRMLINQQRYPYTVRLLFKALEGNAANLPMPMYILSVIMFALRLVEQTTGDFMFWHLHFRNLHRYASSASLDFRYKFCKCWANVCTVVVELYKLYRSRGAERQLRVEYRRPLTFAGGVVIEEREEEKMNRLSEIAEQIRTLRSSRDGSLVSLCCAFLEIWVYLRWAESYKPPAFVPPLCGALSSCIGTYYLWMRTTEKPSEKVTRMAVAEEEAENNLVYNRGLYATAQLQLEMQMHAH